MLRIQLMTIISRCMTCTCKLIFPYIHVPLIFCENGLEGTAIATRDLVIIGCSCMVGYHQWHPGFFVHRNERFENLSPQVSLHS